MTSELTLSALDFHDRLITVNGVRNASGFSPHGQQARFKVLTSIIQSMPRPVDRLVRVLDYGCATGDFLSCLADVAFQRVEYLGVDVNPRFIAEARRRFDSPPGAPPWFKFHEGCALSDSTAEVINEFTPDIIVASGVLCLPAEEPRFETLVRRLYGATRSTLAFNVLANPRPGSAPAVAGGMVTWTPGEVLELVGACECASWSLIRDYLHNDMTVVMRHAWSDYTCG